MEVTWDQRVSPAPFQSWVSEHLEAEPRLPLCPVLWNICRRWTRLVPGRLNCFCWRGHCGDGCSGDGGVALGGSGGAGEDGVEEVVEEGLLLESGW